MCVIIGVLLILCVSQSYGVSRNKFRYGTDSVASHESINQIKLGGYNISVAKSVRDEGMGKQRRCFVSNLYVNKPCPRAGYRLIWNNQFQRPYKIPSWNIPHKPYRPNYYNRPAHPDRPWGTPKRPEYQDYAYFMEDQDAWAPKKPKYRPRNPKSPPTGIGVENKAHNKNDIEISGNGSTSNIYIDNEAKNENYIYNIGRK